MNSSNISSEWGIGEMSWLARLCTDHKKTREGCSLSNISNLCIETASIHAISECWLGKSLLCQLPGVLITHKSCQPGPQINIFRPKWGGNGKPLCTGTSIPTQEGWKDAPLFPFLCSQGKIMLVRGWETPPLPFSLPTTAQPGRNPLRKALPCIPLSAPACMAMTKQQSHSNPTARIAAALSSE